MKQIYRYSIFVLTFLVVFVFLLQSYANAASGSKTITSQADWAAGSTSNVTTSAVPGNIQLTSTSGAIDVASYASSDPSKVTTSADSGTKLNSVDDNDSTAWGTAITGPGATSSWTIDMGSTRNFTRINSLVDYQLDAGIVSISMQIRGSTDGASYTTIQTFLQSGSKAWNDTGSISVNYRYIQIYFINIGGDPAGTATTRHYEIDIYENGGTGTHTTGSTQISGTDNISSWNSFTPSQSTPASTTIEYQFRTSTNGSSWSAYTSAVQYLGSPISISALSAQKYLQVKSTLTSTTGNNPSIADFTASYSYTEAGDDPVDDGGDPVVVDDGEDAPVEAGEITISDPSLCEKFDHLNLTPKEVTMLPNTDQIFIAEAIDKNGRAMSGFTFAYIAEKGKIGADGMHKSANEVVNYTVSAKSACNGSASSSVKITENPDEVNSYSDPKECRDCEDVRSSLGEFSISDLFSIDMISKYLTALAIMASIFIVLSPHIANAISQSTFPEIFYGVMLMGRRKRSWGEVYDKYSGIKIPYARINLLSSEKNKTIATSISDKLGRYGFIADPGSYIIVVHKSDYDVLEYNTIIKGKNESVVNKDLALSPIDEKNRKANKLRIFEIFTKIIVYLNCPLIILGILLSIYAYLNDKSTFNLLVLMIYVPILILQISHLFKKRSYGLVTHLKSPVELAMVRVFQNSKLCRTSVSNNKGRYGLLLPMGDYEILGQKGNLSSSNPKKFSVRRGLKVSDENIELVER